MPPKVHKRFIDDESGKDTEDSAVYTSPVGLDNGNAKKKQKKNKKKKKNGLNKVEITTTDDINTTIESHLSNENKNGVKSGDEVEISISNSSKSMKNQSAENDIEKPISSSNGTNKHKNRNIRTEKLVKFIDSDIESDSEFSADDSSDSYLHRIKLRDQLRSVRETLPMYLAGEEVVNRIMKNRVTILLGETGSGKSTQLPQLLYRRMGKEKKIAITQPRRVAAINLAERVSKEMGEVLGEKVGYSVRFMNKWDRRRTKIKFLTDGMLLRELMNDNELKAYDMIILDEAHERTILTDLLMGLVKGIMVKRPELKVIVMSATLDADRFSKFFDNADILFVQGKMYPVERFYIDEPVEDIIDATVDTLCQLNITEPTGDILAFLPGQDEIDKVVRRLIDVAPSFPSQAPKVLPIPLYASLSNTAQQKAFRPTPAHHRKIICATNIAETSLTVPGVRYVVDSGLRKVKMFRPELGLDTLLTTAISQAAANQRMGRAGREAPGKCFRLYTEDTYVTDLPSQTESEILRTDVASAILMLKRVGVKDVLNGFEWLESPGRKALETGLLKLYALRALNEQGDLTDLGRQMAQLPVPPQLAAVLLKAQSLGVLSEVTDVVAFISVENVIGIPPVEMREDVEKRRKEWFGGGSEWGDLVMMKEVYDGFCSLEQSKNDRSRKQWCKDVFVSYKGMKNVLLTRNQIMDYMKGILGHSKKPKAYKNQDSSDLEDDQYDDPFESNISGQYDVSNLLKAFLHGYISNTAIRQPNGQYRTILTSQTLSIHPSSSYFITSRKPPTSSLGECIFYVEFVFTTKAYARTVSPIKLEWVQEIAPHLLN